MRKFVFSIFILYFVDYAAPAIQEEPRFGRPRKINGDAAPDKAQEDLKLIEEITRILDSSVDITSQAPKSNFTPGPPSIIPSSSPQPPSSQPPSSPPSNSAGPPSAKPTIAAPAPPTLTPPPSPSSSSSSSTSSTPLSTVTTTEPSKTTVLIKIDERTTISVEVEDSEDEAPESEESEPTFGIGRNLGAKKRIDVDEAGFRSDDIKKEEKELDVDDVKELIKKTTINQTGDFYITSPSPFPPPPKFFNDSTLDGRDLIDFNQLFVKKGKAVQNTDEISENVTSDPTTSIFTISTSLQDGSTTTSLSTPTPITFRAPHIHSKTCIHLNDLKNIDDVTKLGSIKKETIEVSVEVNGDGDDEESTSDSASESGSNTESESESQSDSESEESSDARRKDHHRRTREKKKVGNSWKKYEMNCDDEEDEKGHICKLWAISGLCSTHKPTMFLFCRKTCLCVGPKGENEKNF